MSGFIAEIIFRVFFRVFFGLVCRVTGFTLMLVLTVGRVKRSWVNHSLTPVIGALFWASVIYGLIMFYAGR